MNNEIFIAGNIIKIIENSRKEALKKVNEEKVMIHDGARPFVTKKIINDVKEALKAYNACLVMVKSVDTIKVVDNNVVKTTPNRETLYNAQTPQAAFRRARKGIQPQQILHLVSADSGSHPEASGRNGPCSGKNHHQHSQIRRTGRRLSRGHDQL